MSSRKQTVANQQQTAADPEVLRLARQQAEQEELPQLTPGQKGSLTKKYGKNGPEENWRRQRTDELVPIVANRLALTRRAIDYVDIKPVVVKPVVLPELDLPKIVVPTSYKVLPPVTAQKTFKSLPVITAVKKLDDNVAPYKDVIYDSVESDDDNDVPLPDDDLWADGWNDDDVPLPGESRSRRHLTPHQRRVRKARNAVLGALKSKAQKIKYLVADPVIEEMANEKARDISYIKNARQDAILRRHYPGKTLQEAFVLSQAKKIAKAIAEAYLAGDTKEVDRWAPEVDYYGDFEYEDEYEETADDLSRKLIPKPRGIPESTDSLPGIIEIQRNVQTENTGEMTNGHLDVIYSAINEMRRNNDVGAYNIQYGFTYQAKRGIAFLPVGKLQVDQDTDVLKEYRELWEYGTGWITDNINPAGPSRLYIDNDSFPMFVTGFRVYCVPHNDNPRPRRLAKNPIENCLVAILRYRLGGELVDTALSRDADTAHLINRHRTPDEIYGADSHRYTYVGPELIERISQLCCTKINIFTAADDALNRRKSPWVSIGDGPKAISVISDDEHARIPPENIIPKKVKYEEDMNMIARYHPKVIENKPGKPDQCDYGYVVLDNGTLYKQFRPSSITGNHLDDDLEEYFKITSPRSFIFKLFLKENKIRNTPDILVPIIKRSLRWIGAFQGEGPEERISIDHNSSYCSYETNKYYMGFPSHGLVAVTPDVSECPAYYICRRVTPPASLVGWWNHIFGSCHNVLPTPLYRWAIDNGFDIDVEFILEDIIGLRRFSIIGFYDRFTVSDEDSPNKPEMIPQSAIKIVRNAAIGCLIRGGVDGKKVHKITTTSLEEAQQIINTCEETNTEYKFSVEETTAVGSKFRKSDGTTYHIEISKQAKEISGVFHVYSYILAYSHIAVLSKIVETAHLNPVGYRVDCLYYPDNAATRAELAESSSTEIGQWKVSRCIKIDKDFQSELSDRRDRFPPISGIIPCDYKIPRNRTIITGPAGISKSYKFTTRPPLGSMVLTPTILLGAFHNSKRANTAIDEIGFDNYRADFQEKAAEAVEKKSTYRLPKLAYTAAKVFQFTKEGEWFNEMIQNLPSAAIYFIDECFLFNANQWKIIHERACESVIVALGDPYQINSSVAGDPMMLKDFIAAGYTEVKIERDPAITYYRHEFDWGSQLDVIRIAAAKCYDDHKTAMDSKNKFEKGKYKKLIVKHAKDVCKLFEGTPVNIYREHKHDGILEDEGLIERLNHIVVGVHRRGNKINQAARELYGRLGRKFPVRIVCKQIVEEYSPDDFADQETANEIAARIEAGKPVQVTAKNLCRFAPKLTDEAFKRLAKATTYSTQPTVPATTDDGRVAIKGQIVYVDVNDPKIWWDRKACLDVVPAGFDYEAAYALTADCLQGSTIEIPIGIDLLTLNRHGAVYSAVTRTTKPELNTIITPDYDFSVDKYKPDDDALCNLESELKPYDLKALDKYRSVKDDAGTSPDENWKDSCARIRNDGRFMSFTANTWDDYKEFLRLAFECTDDWRNLNEFVGKRALPVRFYLDIDEHLDQTATITLVDSLRAIFSGPIEVLRNDSTGKLHILTDVTFKEDSLDFLIDSIYKWDVENLTVSQQAYIVKWIAKRKWLSLKEIRVAVGKALRSYLWPKFEYIYPRLTEFNKVFDVTAPGLRAPYSCKMDDGVLKPAAGYYVATDDSFNCVKLDEKAKLETVLRCSIYAPTQGRLLYDEGPIAYHIENTIKDLLIKKADKKNGLRSVVKITPEDLYRIQAFIGLDLREAPEYDVPIGGSAEAGYITQKVKMDAEAIETILSGDCGYELKNNQWSSRACPMFKKIHAAIPFDTEKLFAWYLKSANKHNLEQLRSIWAKTKYEWDVRPIGYSIGVLLVQYFHSVKQHPGMRTAVEYKLENIDSTATDYNEMARHNALSAVYDYKMYSERMTALANDIGEDNDSFQVVSSFASKLSAMSESCLIAANTDSFKWDLYLSLLDDVRGIMNTKGLPKAAIVEFNAVAKEINAINSRLKPRVHKPAERSQPSTVEATAEPRQLTADNDETIRMLELLDDGPRYLIPQKAALFKNDIRRVRLIELVSKSGKQVIAPGWSIIDSVVHQDNKPISFENALSKVHMGLLKLPEKSNGIPVEINEVPFNPPLGANVQLVWAGTDQTFEVQVSIYGIVTYAGKPLEVKSIIDVVEAVLGDPTASRSVKYTVARREASMFDIILPPFTAPTANSISKPPKPSTQYAAARASKIETDRAKGLAEIGLKVEMSVNEYKRRLWDGTEEKIEKEIEVGSIAAEDKFKAIHSSIEKKVTNSEFTKEWNEWAAEESDKLNSKLDKQLARRKNRYQKKVAEDEKADKCAISSIQESLKAPLPERKQPAPKLAKEDLAALRAAKMAAAREKLAEVRAKKAEARAKRTGEAAPIPAEVVVAAIIAKAKVTSPVHIEAISESTVQVERESTGPWYADVDYSMVPIEINSSGLRVEVFGDVVEPILDQDTGIRYNAILINTAECIRADTGSFPELYNKEIAAKYFEMEAEAIARIQRETTERLNLEAVSNHWISHRNRYDLTEYEVKQIRRDILNEKFVVDGEDCGYRAIAILNRMAQGMFRQLEDVAEQRKKGLPESVCQKKEADIKNEQQRLWNIIHALENQVKTIENRIAEWIPKKCNRANTRHYSRLSEEIRKMIKGENFDSDDAFEKRVADIIAYEKAEYKKEQAEEGGEVNKKAAALAKARATRAAKRAQK